MGYEQGQQQPDGRLHASVSAGLWGDSVFLRTDQTEAYVERLFDSGTGLGFIAAIDLAANYITHLSNPNAEVGAFMDFHTSRAEASQVLEVAKWTSDKAEAQSNRALIEARAASNSVLIGSTKVMADTPEQMMNVYCLNLPTNEGNYQEDEARQSNLIATLKGFLGKVPLAVGSLFSE